MAESEKYICSNAGDQILREIILDNGHSFVSRMDIPDHCDVSKDPHDCFDQAFLVGKSVLESPRELKPFRVADIFSGCGGLSLGAREAATSLGRKLHVVLALDNDTATAEVYQSNFNPDLFYCDDVLDLIDGDFGKDPTQAERSILESIGQLDLLLAGPPCQGHSGLNNHTRHKDSRNKLYDRVGRFAELSRPTNILVENVPAIIHAYDRSHQRTVEHLINLGYQVDSSVVNLSKLGVPQLRKRHVLVASLKRETKVDDIVSSFKISNPRTVRWAIKDLEYEPPNGIFTIPTEHSEENIKRIDYLFDKDRYDLPNRLRPKCHQNGHTYKSMYGRLKYDKPAQTITSGYGSPGQGRYIHPTRRRTLTPHEAARLQFFPDSFDFSKATTRGALSRMIGNAVPLKLSYIFCLEFLS